MPTVIEKQYGQFVIDFINADTTECAILSFLLNLQRQFSFSDDFCNLVKNLYPSINVIASLLGQSDQILLDLILKKNGIINRLNDRFKIINYAVESYNPFSGNISLISLDWNRGNNGSMPPDDEQGLSDSDGGFLETLKLLGLSIVDGPVFIKLDAVKNEIEALLGQQAADDLNQLIAIGCRIADSTAVTDRSRYEELNLLAEEHREVVEFHSQVEGIQIDCKQILEMVIDGQPYSQIPNFDHYLELFNNFGSHRMEINGDDCLMPVSLFEENQYLAIRDVDAWLHEISKAMAYCLIKFLKNGNNRHYLKKCPTCQQYFIARQPRRQKFCQKACRLNSHTKPTQMAER